MNFTLILLLVLIAVLFFTKDLRNDGFMSNVEQVQSREGFDVGPGVMDQLASTEAFGMSPGTMDQLSSTRSPKFPMRIDVNAKPDQPLEDLVQDRLTEKGILDMTQPGSFISDYAPASLR
jgi:hypothetical protein